MKAEDRTKLLLRAFGWQGGTIHQLAEETGCYADDLLHRNLESVDSTSFQMGAHNTRLYSVELNRATNFKNHKGDLNYWFGVMAGEQLKEDETPTKLTRKE